VNIDLFTVQMRTEFLNSMQAVPAKEPPWQRFTLVVGSTGRTENQAWMTPAPGISQYAGHRRFARLDQIKYTLENLEFDGGFSVSNRDVADDIIGGWKLRFQDLGEKARVFPGRWVLQRLAQGATRPCFDGTNLFATAHNQGGYPAGAPAGFGGGGNSFTYTSANSADGVVNKVVFMLHYGPLKPMIYQNRKGPEFQTDAGTPESSKAKQSNYWIDMEGEAGYGMWWDMILVTITNTPNLQDIFNIVDAVQKQFLLFTLPAALPTDPALYVHQDLEFGEDVGTVICHPNLYMLFKHAFKEDRVGVSVAGSTSGITSNIYYGGWNLIGSGYLV
jgi:phage major head subunit gpT-like protein